MTFTQPLRLLRDGRPFGTIVSYGYETPWASGRVVADDPGDHARQIAVAAFLRWVEALPDDLPDAEADARYERELASRRLTEDDVGRWSAADWTIVTADGSRRPAYALSFDGGGFVTWRWCVPGQPRGARVQATTSRRRAKWRSGGASGSVRPCCAVSARQRRVPSAGWRGQGTWWMSPRSTRPCRSVV